MEMEKSLVMPITLCAGYTLTFNNLRNVDEKELIKFKTINFKRIKVIVQ